MNEREVTFEDKQGRKIVGTLLIPDWTKQVPVVILCHGFKGDRNEKHIRAISDELCKGGLASLRIDFTRDPGESSLHFEDFTISYELEVLDQAVNFVKSQKEIDPNKIGLAGHSLGGLVVAWYVATHPDIAALATLSAVYNFEKTWRHEYSDTINEFKEKGFANFHSTHLNRVLKLKAGFYDDALSYDMDKVIESLVCPILVVAGTDDQAVTMDHAQNFYDRAFSKEKQLKVIKGSDHNYTKEGNLDEVKTAVADWFAKTLL